MSEEQDHEEEGMRTCEDFRSCDAHDADGGAAIRNALVGMKCSCGNESEATL